MSDLAAPRTTAATNGREVARVLSQRRGLPAAWWGMVMLIATEGMLFGCLVGSYYYLRFQNKAWPLPGDPKPELVIPLIMLAVLVSTSVPMQLASLAVRAGRVAAGRLFVFSAFVVQCGYFAYEVHDYDDQLHASPIAHDAYTSIYYTLLGADHAHVLFGILFDAWLLMKLARGLTTYRANATQAITWYWHAVNAITIIVIGTLLSARA